MFIEVLFIMTKTWKQPKSPLTDEWIKKISYTHTHTHNGILFSHKNEIMLFVATWINLEIIILSEVSPTEKDKYILLVCGKTMQINLYNRTEIDPQT